MFPPEVQMRCLMIALSLLSLPAFAQTSHPSGSLNNTLRMNQGLIDFALAVRRDAERKARILQEVAALILSDLQFRSADVSPIAPPVLPSSFVPPTMLRDFFDLVLRPSG